MKIAIELESYETLGRVSNSIKSFLKNWEFFNDIKILRVGLEATKERKIVFEVLDFHKDVEVYY